MPVVQFSEAGIRDDVGVIGEGLSVKTAKSVMRGEPQIPIEIFLDLRHEIAAQAVFLGQLRKRLAVVAIGALHVASKPIGAVPILNHAADVLAKLRNRISRDRDRSLCSLLLNGFLNLSAAGCGCQEDQKGEEAGEGHGCGVNGESFFLDTMSSYGNATTRHT